MTRPPYDRRVLDNLPLTDLAQRWRDAQHRIWLAEDKVGLPDPADYWTALAAGTRIARRTTAFQWEKVAELLRAGAVESWTQVGQALDMTETDARDEFRGWVNWQITLRRRSELLGLSETEATELHTLAEAVAG
jgi:hypothetical protein